MTQIAHISSWWKQFTQYASLVNNPDAAWETMLSEVFMATAEIPNDNPELRIPATYSMRVYPLNQNHIGAKTADVQIGYKLLDYVGQIYEVVNVNGDRIIVSDILFSSYSPQSGRPALIYNIQNTPTAADIITANSVVGDGTVENPIQLKNDTATPQQLYYYGTNVNGVLGYHKLPFSGDNVYIVYNETELLAAYADAITYVGKAATIYIGATITLTNNRTFKRTASDAKIEFYGIGVGQQIAIGSYTLTVNYITFRNITFSTTGTVYVTVDGCYAYFYSCKWIDEQLYSATFSNMKIAIKCIGTISNGTGQIFIDDLYHSSWWNYSVNSGDIQPFIIQNATTWGASTDNFYINIVRVQALMNYDTVARVLLHATVANTPFKVTGDLTWHYHPDQAMPGSGNIASYAKILKRGSVDDLRGDLIPTGTIVSLIGLDVNKKIRTQTGYYDTRTLQIQNITLLEENWVLDVDGFYHYQLYNANITTDTIVEIIPADSAYYILVESKPLPKVISDNGYCIIKMINAPLNDINVTINLTIKRT